jgi:hypothetical protein
MSKELIPVRNFSAKYKSQLFIEHCSPFNGIMFYQQSKCNGVGMRISNF